jgi:hypothetical protein
MDRTFEREILPMAREHGMALCPWNVLASGKLRSDAEEERREKSGEMGRDIKIDDNGWKRTPAEKKMSNALEKVAKEVGVDSVTAGWFNSTFESPVIDHHPSRHRLPPPQSALRFPHGWGSQNRTSAPEH